MDTNQQERMKEAVKNLLAPSSGYLENQNAMERTKVISQGRQAVIEDCLNQIPTTNARNIISQLNANGMSQQQWSFFLNELGGDACGFVNVFVESVVGSILSADPFVSSTSEDLAKELTEDFTGTNTNLSSFIQQAVRSYLTTGNSVAILYPQFQPAVSEDDEEEVIVSLGDPENRPIIKVFDGDANIQRVVSTRGDVLLLTFLTTVQIPTGSFGFEERNAIQVFSREPSEDGSTQVIVHTFIANSESSVFNPSFDLYESAPIVIAGEPVRAIEQICVDLSGSWDYTKPVCSDIAEAECQVINLSCRHNHIMNGSATITPIISADSMLEDEIEALVKNGLGSWMVLSGDSSISMLEYPSDGSSALSQAIKDAKQTMVALGVSSLSSTTLSRADSSESVVQLNAQQKHLVSSIVRNLTLALTKLANVYAKATYGIQDTTSLDIKVSIKSLLDVRSIQSNLLQVLSSSEMPITDTELRSILADANLINQNQVDDYVAPEAPEPTTFQ